MGIEVQGFGGPEERGRLFILTNANGTEAAFTDVGASWVSMKVRDGAGEFADVLLGYGEPRRYAENQFFLGACVGRSANRIAGGDFVLDGKRVRLAKNDGGKNNLHSGPDYWCGKLFLAETEESSLGSRVRFRLRAEDGSQGFPGNLDFAVSYTLTEDDAVMIEYWAVSDAATVINPTNHAYFNLRGHAAGGIEEQELWINADYFTPVDALTIPTGELRKTAGTPFDFTLKKKIGEGLRAEDRQLELGNGYDHNFVLNGWDGKLNLVAKARDGESGRSLKIYTDLPGLQFYTGNFLRADGPGGKDGASYGPRAGYCFETQYYPDAVHHPEWPQPVFQAGEEYRHFTIYKFVARKDEEETD